MRLLVGIFFRQVEVVGRENVPDEGEGPVIFCGNHPNSLLDPTLLVVTSGRIVHFAAADVLFKSRFLKVFLGALGAVPVARRSDHGEAVDNRSMFAALHDVLVAGRCVGIFPEGLSHHESSLQRLRSGASRIALGASRLTPLRIVPCGLVYVRRKRFRSRVLVQYGEPIVVQAPDSDDPPRDDVSALTTEIEHGLRALTVNAPDWDTLRVLDAVRRMYQPPRISLEDRAELTRRFAERYVEIAGEPEVRALYERVAIWLDKLVAVGLSDRHLRRALRPREVVGRIIANLLLIFVWLPLALPGVIVLVPLAYVVRGAGVALSPRKDVVATAKLVAGLIGIGGLYAAATAWAAWAGGWPWALAVFVAVPLSGLATVKILERTASVRRLASWLLQCALLRGTRSALKEERDELEAAIVQAVRHYIPEDMEPLFPRNVAAEGAEPQGQPAGRGT